MNQQDSQTIITKLKTSPTLQLTIIIILVIFTPILGYINPISGLGTWVLIIIPLVVLIIQDIDQVKNYKHIAYLHKYFLLYSGFSLRLRFKPEVVCSRRSM